MNDLITRATILGQLRLRPWGSYELVKEMRRNLRFLRPRAESRIYATLKVLERAGEVRSVDVGVGKRASKVWQVAPAGAQAFADWLASPPAATSLDCDAVVRILLAPGVDDPAVGAAIDAVRAEAEELYGVARAIAQEYQAGAAPFQTHVRQRALVFDFLVSWAQMRRQWAARAEALRTELAACDPSDADARAVAHIALRLGADADGGA